MPKQANYPQSIYVKRENPGTNDEYLQAFDQPSLAAQPDETVTLALYEFRRLVRIKAPVSLTT